MADLENVIAALNLEYGADRRYAYQVEHSAFPAINAMLEGVRRTEGDHVEAMFAYIKARQETDGAAGRGFATLLAHLRLNLEFERSALAAYAQFARGADDPALKRTFQQLAHSEAGHLKLFQGLIEQIEANQYPVFIYCPVCGWELDFGTNPAVGAVVRCEKCKQKVALSITEGDFVVEAVSERMKDEG